MVLSERKPAIVNDRKFAKRFCMYVYVFVCIVRKSSCVVEEWRDGGCKTLRSHREGSGELAAKGELFIRCHSHSFPPSIDRCLGESIWLVCLDTHTYVTRKGGRCWGVTIDDW